MKILPVWTLISAWNRMAISPDPDLLIRRILQEPAYRQAGRSLEQPTLWDVVKKWVRAYFEHHPMHGGAALVQPLTIFTAVIAVVVGFFTLAALGVALLTFLQRPRSAKKPKPAVMSEDIVQRYDAQTLLRICDDLAAQETFEPAIAMLFQAATRLCDERGIVRFERALTADEYRRRLRDQPLSATTAFDEVARFAIRATFDRPKKDPAAWRQARAAYVQFVDALPCA